MNDYERRDPSEAFEQELARGNVTRFLAISRPVQPSAVLEKGTSEQPHVAEAVTQTISEGRESGGETG